MIAEWRNKNSGTTINKEVKDWWWCSKYCNGRGLHACHKSEGHEKPFQLRRREEIVAAIGATYNDKPNTSRKLKLSCSMKTSLLTMGILTEERAEAIDQERKTHLLKDF